MTTLLSRRPSAKSRVRSSGRAKYGAFFETLETRILMSMVGVAPLKPLTIYFSAAGSQTYTVTGPNTGAFSIGAPLTAFVAQDGTIADVVNGNFALNITLNGSGQVIGGNPSPAKVHS